MTLSMYRVPPITTLSSSGTKTYLILVPIWACRMSPIRSGHGAKAFEVRSSGEELITALDR